MLFMLVLLILTPGTASAVRSVTFQNPNPCGLKGSSVEFSCSYNYTERETVKRTAWSRGGFENGTWKRFELSDLHSYQNRFEYLGDQQHDCRLAIHHLQDNDTGHYYFRFDTEKFGRRSKNSVYLTVTELRASVTPDRVRAGDNVALECAFVKSSCQLPRTVWFKDGRPFAKTEFQAEAEDAGSYSCAAEGQEAVLSDPVALDVQYPPLTVAVNYCTNVIEGSRVNLTCSSDANPAADYTWFRSTASSLSSVVQVGSGQVLSVPSVEASHDGLYFCQARNHLGENNSTTVLLTVDKSDKLRASVTPDRVRAGDNVTLKCAFVKSSCQLPRTVWFKDGRPFAKTQFQAEAEDAGSYSCAAEGQEAVLSDPVALDVQYPPLTVAVNYSTHVIEGSRVNLTCSSDANPAADYTWFRSTASSLSSVVQVGSGQVLSVPSVEASHDGLYFCQARNHLGENNSTTVLLTVDKSDKLRASVTPDRVRAGDNVTLKCAFVKSSCQLPRTVWFKDGRPFAKTQFQAEAEDAGSYSCAAEGQEAMLSDPVALDVQYPPLTVAVNYSTHVMECSRVNLTCSSDANPAADYTWFRSTASSLSSVVQVGSGQVLSVPSVEAPHDGLYFCQARNHLGENNSTTVLLTVDKTDTVDIIIFVGIGVKGFIILLLPLVIMWAWRKLRRSSLTAVHKERNSSDYENEQIYTE